MDQMAIILSAEASTSVVQPTRLSLITSKKPSIRVTPEANMRGTRDSTPSLTSFPGRRSTLRNSDGFNN